MASMLRTERIDDNAVVVTDPRFTSATAGKSSANSDVDTVLAALLGAGVVIAGVAAILSLLSKAKPGTK